MSKITIIDAPCGTGKTTWAIQEMCSNTETSYIYCTPFLDEITRVREVCGKGRFREPLNYDTTKIDDFNALLASGTDIAVTHTTFINATPDTMNLIRQGEYTLILDEALDVIVDFNDTSGVKSSPEQAIKQGDIQMLLENELIALDNLRVVWTGGEYKDCKFTEVERLAKLNRLYCIKEKMMVCIYPPEIFESFNEVYIMTYLFDGCILKSYFDLFGISYKLAGIVRDGEKCIVSSYSMEADKRFRNKCKELITIFETDRLVKGYKKTAFSKSWYESNIGDHEVAKRLRDDLTYFFRVIGAKARNKDILYGCPKKFKDRVQGKGYTCVRQLTREENALPETKREELEKQLTCYLPLNAKATNDYKERWALAYCYNMNINPMFLRLFENGEVKFNENLFSVSCLIQWIFRSRIRDGKNIVIYLPSPRMRRLLRDWLDYKI